MESLPDKRPAGIFFMNAAGIPAGMHPGLTISRMILNFVKKTI